MANDSPAQRAIVAFERVHDLMVTIHDRTGLLSSAIDSRWATHRHPLCTAAKVEDVAACVAFDVRRTAQELAANPDGRAHRCWAGVVEWAVPIAVDGELAAVVFAGVRRAGTGAQAVVLSVDDAVRAPGIGLRVVDEEASQLALECLRQLAARLAHWIGADIGGIRRPLPRRQLELIPDARARRHLAIRTFIERNYLREIAVSDLARALGLSVGRTIHAVREVCGQSFVQLLHDKRLAAAAAALRHSELDVMTIASRSGFQDLSHFHRCFKRRFGATPLRYRLASGS